MASHGYPYGVEAATYKFSQIMRRVIVANFDKLHQGVVTYISPVEAFATAIKFFDRQKVCLIA